MIEVMCGENRKDTTLLKKALEALNRPIPPRGEERTGGGTLARSMASRLLL